MNMPQNSDDFHRFILPAIEADVVEIVVLSLLAGLIVVLSIPVFGELLYSLQ